MVKAILEGRKTQTRRILKMANNIANPKFGYTCFTPDRHISVRGLHGGIFAESFIKCPYGKDGDILWVRETWRGIEQDFGEPRYEYKATERVNLMDKWKPSIFMPKAACRLFLEIDGINGIMVERLQDISEEDAIAEGVNIRYDKDEDGLVIYDGRAKEAYEELWKSINGAESWEENPWVFVISFKKIDNGK